MMKLLLEELNSIPLEVHNQISNRISSFRNIKDEGPERLFLELSFCMLTANYDAQKAIRIQEAIWNGFIDMDENILSHNLRMLGYRFPNMRASYIVGARKHKDILYSIVYPEGHDWNTDYENQNIARLWLADNVRGLGMKESSHFLRNVGYNKLGIIDFHILDILVRHNLIEPYKSRSLTRNKYVEIERILHDIGDYIGMDMAVLDYCLWYIETGKVLK
ncbi:MAG: N-glycosylase/DNA lyase [Candidatus Woesearchaeota archaeon]